MTPDQFDRLPKQVQQAWELVWLYKLKPGDEHPTRKGWRLQSELGDGAEPLWVKPPHPVWKWIRFGLIGLIVVSFGSLAIAGLLLN